LTSHCLPWHSYILIFISFFPWPSLFLTKRNSTGWDVILYWPPLRWPLASSAWRPFPWSLHRSIYGICDWWVSTNALLPHMNSTHHANSLYQVCIIIQFHLLHLAEFFLAVCGIRKFNVLFKRVYK
jgi:hypothetical protein